MKLTLGQVRGALQLSQDAYRHWKKVLLPLANRNGHKPSFSHGDLLALAIIKSLTDKIGVPVGDLDAVARSLFEQCAQEPWARFEKLVAIVQPQNGSLSFLPDTEVAPITLATIIIPCEPLVATLRMALMAEQAEEPQGALRFPLASVTTDRRSAGGETL